MLKTSFDKLVDKLKAHHLYQDKGGRPQHNIQLQVAVVLERLGTYGNGVSHHGRLARRNGVGSKSAYSLDFRLLELTLLFRR